MFAIYKNTAVEVIEIEGDEALISHDCGKEEYVDVQTLNFIG